MRDEIMFEEFEAEKFDILVAFYEDMGYDTESAEQIAELEILEPKGK